MDGIFYGGEENFLQPCCKIVLTTVSSLASRLASQTVPPRTTRSQIAHPERFALPLVPFTVQFSSF